MISRRDFLKRASTATFALSGFNTRAYGRAEALGPLAATALPTTDRVLVIVQLDGGNDGLNTLINYENDAYYRARPVLQIPKNEVLPLSDTLGLHPDLKGFHRGFSEGTMMGIQGVGYPNPDRSHFRATDIWLTASDADEYLATGWLGRYLEKQTPDFPNTLPEHPLAIDIGPVISLSLLGRNGSLGIALRNPQQFYNLVDNGNKILGENAPPPTPAGFELDFVRQINAESLQYASEVQAASEAGLNQASYPSGTLSEQLALIARLIHGGLKTRVYLVSQKGYDTHANQLVRHSALLTELDEAVTAFQTDLTMLGLSDRVLGMTISEFGRRVRENGSVGTDHGTSAPMFLFGTSLRGGLVGPDQDFDTLDTRGDFIHSYDFRKLYGSVLSQWFGVPRTVIETVLPSARSRIRLIRDPELEPADFNSDGDVNFDDFLEFARFFGSTEAKYDLDGDGRVGFNDFLKFVDLFGKARA